MLPANNNFKEKFFIHPNLLSEWIILFFSLIIIAIMIVFFPGKRLIDTVVNTKNPEPISLFYLVNLVQQDPTNKEYRIALITQALFSDKLEIAKKQLTILSQPPFKLSQQEMEWLRYAILRSEFYQLPKNAPLRADREKELLHKIKNLSHESKNYERLQQLATDALQLESPQLSLEIYLKMNSIKKIEDLNTLIKIAQVALSGKNYLISGQYYFYSLGKTSNLQTQKWLFVSGLKAYQAGGYLSQGLEKINTIPQQIIQDPTILNFLADYALTAGKPELAQKYMKTLLLMESKAS